MKKYMKFISVIILISWCLGVLAACSTEKEIESDGYTNEEILDKYQGIANQADADKPIDSGASVLGVGFSEVDFTFTSADDTLAFSLDKNSFVKLAPGGTFYNYIKPGSELSSFDAGYKTARGVSLETPAKDILLTYGITDENAIFLKPGDTIYYNPSSGNFSGKLTALYALKDGETVYKLLKSKDIQKFIYKRPTDSAYMNPEAILSEFPEYISLVSIDITSDEEGNVSEIVFCKFDK